MKDRMSVDALLERSTLSQPVQSFSRSEGHPPFDEFEYRDSEDERSVIKHLALRCVAEKTSLAALVFAYPGNGKRGFAKEAVNDLLNFHPEFGAVWTDLAAMVVSTDSALSTSLGRLEESLARAAQHPLLFVVENLDSLDFLLGEQTQKARSEKLVHELARLGATPQTVLLTTSRDPSRGTNVLTTADIRPECKVYFPWPNDQKTEDLIRSFSTFRNPKAIAQELFRLSNSWRVRFTTASVIRGTIQAIRTTSRLSELPPKRVAKIIIEFCSPTPIADMEAYRREHSNDIQDARRDLRRLSLLARRANKSTESI